MKKYYRSGDHSFHPVEKLPEGLKKIDHDGTFVFGVGEASNHFHKITIKDKPKVTVKDKPKMNIYQDKNGDYYFDLLADATLTHTEGKTSTKTADHQPIVLPMGVYRQVHEREIDIFSKTVRRVVD